jgi:Tol biopolymer transport system component
VVFVSYANNLVEGENEGVLNVFVRDLVTGTTTLVSRDGPAGAGADGHSEEPAISPDGRYVAFYSVATNLSSEDVDAAHDVFLRDLDTGVNTLISRATGTDPAGAGNGRSEISGPVVSSGGRFVLFRSAATNLVTPDGNGQPDLFVRDTAQNTTVLVSRKAGADGDIANTDSWPGSITPDGRYVTIESEASNLVADDTNGEADIFIRDMQDQSLELISRPTGTGGPVGNTPNGDWSFAPQASDDGRFVAFYGENDDLSTEDDNSAINVFVRDRQENTLHLASRAAGATGAGADDDSEYASISPDGRFVAFWSNANNLVEGEDEGFKNVFLRQFRDPPVNTSAPGISGTAQQGQALSCSDGIWQGAGLTLGHQWNRGGSPIGGATTAIHTLTADDVGRAITCTVTASNADGTASATSASVTPVAASSGGGDPGPSDPGPSDPGPTEPTAPGSSTGGTVSIKRSGSTFVVNTGISVSCPAGGPTCTASLVATSNVPSSLAKAKRLTIGKAKFTIAAGKKIKLTFKLKSKAARALRKLGRLKAKVVVTARAGTGSPVTIRKTIKVKRPKP